MGQRERNLNQISRGFPELYQRIRDTDAGSVRADFEGITHRKTLTEDIALIVKDRQGKAWRLNSAYHPRHQAEVWLAGQEGLQASNLFLFGLGNGVFASELLRHKKEGAKVLIYEPSPQLFLYVLEHADLTPFFSEQDVRVIVEGFNEDMYSGVMEEMLTYENFEDRAFFVCPEFGRLFPEARKRFVDRYIDGVGVLMSNRNTIRRFLHVSPFNQMYNLRYLSENTVVTRLKSVWETETPVAVIGAGPSLQEAVGTLRAMGDRMFLFAVDSALSFLLANDIVPDATICVEADKPMHYFDDDRALDIPLFCKTDTTHKLLSVHRGEKVFGYEEGLVNDIYDSYHVPRAAYRYGGNGATSFFAVCGELGVKHVFLVGQDMVYGKDGTTHVGTRDEGYVEEKRFLCINNRGETVKSRQDWHRFIQWYENAIPVLPFDHVINTSEYGARIAGTEYMPLAEAVSLYGREHTPVGELCRRAERTFAGETFDAAAFYDKLGDEAEQLQTMLQSGTYAKQRSRYSLYHLLRLYEIADTEGNLEQSQRKGLELLTQYLKRCREEDPA